MQRTILGSFFLILCITLNGQARLDSLYAITRHESRGEIIALDGNELVVVGSARETSTFRLGIAFTRISLDGEILVSGYEFDSLTYFVICNELILQDSFAYVLPYMGWSPYYLLNTINTQVIF